MNTRDGTTRLSLFMQVDSMSEDEMVAGLHHIRDHHRNPAKEDYVFNLVLNETGHYDGTLRTPTLDTLADFLPGGPMPAFDNVFVGSAVLPWAGPGNPYREGMASELFRWENLLLQRNLWHAFQARYPHVPFHFYINYEGVLDYFEEEPLRSYYEAFLVQSVRDSHKVRPNHAVLWSPAVWRDNALSTPEVDAVVRTLSNVKYHANQVGHDRGISWLHLQDMLGREWSGNDLDDVRTWYWQLENAWEFDSLRIDAELFTPDYQPLSPAEYAHRMNYYDLHDLPVGASWEFRYWFRDHMDV